MAVDYRLGGTCLDRQMAGESQSNMVYNILINRQLLSQCVGIYRQMYRHPKHPPPGFNRKSLPIFGAISYTIVEQFLQEQYYNGRNI